MLYSVPTPTRESTVSTRWTLTIDCAHPATLAAFWRLALGYVEASPPQGFATWAEWLEHYRGPPEEWDDGAYIEDPDGWVPASHSSRSLSPRPPRTASTWMCRR